MRFLTSNLIDIDYLQWLIWLLSPIVISFLLPLTILLFFYCSALFLHVYRHRNRITAIKEAVRAGDYWDGARQAIATFWDAHGWIYHGYEVKGLDNIPDSGPALIVYYHGALPLDYYYLLSKTYLHKNRLIKAVGDKFLFSIPGWKLMMEVFHVFPGTLKTCTQVLQRGDLLSIAPGGVREAQFGDNRYKLIWGNRIGFAKVAIASKAPIVPVFTVNLREAFRSVSFGQSWFERVYDKTRLPIVPIYGGFPVKMTTFIGEPIPYKPNRTPEELAALTAEAIEKLIQENQRIPGSIWRAIFDRFKSS
ncbi:transmembrane protein 68 [Tetranychus urticae]|uniref:Phospholipid/glycerol acyltransferase domain-containing protein n=1 Tax=Tetranychus urticae TaxID=32264 RepID=T1KD07_TETUR|nr:transmembrane protein 68 [Tetranychus urticae]